MSTSCQVEAGCLIFISCIVCLLPHLPLRLSMGLEQEEVKEVPEDSLDEKYLMHSSRHDSHQPPSSIASVHNEQDKL